MKQGFKRRRFLLLLIVAGVICAEAQPFREDILAFKKQDSLHPPQGNAILFVGSSSFTKWTDVQNYFPGFLIINRGFGGSSLPDLIRYANDVIISYHPRQVVIYCGDNDLAASDTVSSATVVSRFKALFALIRLQLPGEPIAFISIKPSPSRAKLMPKMAEANRAIKQFLAGQKNTAFIDVYHLMLDKDGKPIDEIFVGDKLHMNSKGYAIWQKAIKPFLLQ
ncbi:MAG TPA: GDSL-type esterase/lipase family protein [Puia sp.]|nr:GDSL-type esterase/lipase family protein [Puia sp.]